MKNTLYKNYAKSWLKKEKSFIKKSSYESFELHMVNHVLPYFGEMKITEINNEKIQQFILHLFKSGRIDEKGGLCVKTIKNVVLVLKLSLQDAMDNNLIKPFEFNFKYPKEDKIDMVDCLSLEETKLLIQNIYLNLNNKTLGILICLTCGLRIGEITALRFSDIDLENNTITISKTLQRVYSKEKGNSKIEIGTPKTNSSYRIIPIPTNLIPFLRKFKQNNNHYVLTGTNKPTEPRTYRQWFNNFMKKNNMRQIKFHGLRHTFAMRAIEIPDFDIKSLALVLGHKSPAFTLSVYGRADVTQTKKCMNLINNLF